MRIFQISTFDLSGGAERVAWNLFCAYRSRGFASKLLVGHKESTDPDIAAINQERQPRSWGKYRWLLYQNLTVSGAYIPGMRTISTLLRKSISARYKLEQWLGIENFNFPGTYSVLDSRYGRPDLIHCHNLHGGYFDLQALPWLSRQVPVVMTLHDAWLLSGHCAHSFDCRRWQFGCGRCPDLTIYPAIKRDATAYNWKRKQRIYADSRLYISTPCQWLMQRVQQSILAPAIQEARVIPYGVDLTVFHPADKDVVRSALDIPRDAIVLLFAANGVRQNIWKDYRTLRTAVSRIAEQMAGQAVLFLALGDDAASETIGSAEIRFIPFQRDLSSIARYYQAADLYVHAARADTFPNVILEALACGLPVVATAIGGIPEQVKSLFSLPGAISHSVSQATGVLTPAGDAEKLASGVVYLLKNPDILQQIGRNAALDAQQRFDLNVQVETHLLWYHSILKTFPGN